MERLELVFSLDPNYAADVVTFVGQNPVFYRFLSLLSLTSRAVLPHFPTAKDALKYYVCFAGVRTAYGHQCWGQVQHHDYTHLKSKRVIIETIDTIPDITSSEMVDMISIKGVGPGAKTFVKENVFGDRQHAIYPTDLTFRKGLAVIYELPKPPSVTEATRLCESWKGPKYVGSMFAFQCAII